jgi:antirestriction protein ArdC
LSFERCDFSREELVAEIGSAMLLSECNIAHEAKSDRATGWLAVLESDEKRLVFACAAAQEAVDYILVKATGTPADTPREVEIAKTEPALATA